MSSAVNLLFRSLVYVSLTDSLIVLSETIDCMYFILRSMVRRKKFAPLMTWSKWQVGNYIILAYTNSGCVAKIKTNLCIAFYSRLSRDKPK